ncbi:hypothetical protein WSM22_35900 [Cytophagales bacterium WSM2-2]|nr:hypothetical protein WSM22_35900 [Cytophagales bacterium WSM2-2]
MKELLFERPNVIIEKDDSLKAVIVRFNGYVKSEEYREAMNKGAEVVKDPAIRFWLQDNTNAGILSIDDQHWVTTVHTPRVNPFIEKLAIVASKDVFRKFAEKKFDEKSAGARKFNFRYFDNIQSAELWLKS